MSRELPYFKFFTGEWLNGDITLEDYETQGLFINVCSYYWHRDCEVNYHQLAKKFKTNLLADLVPEFMQCDEENDHSITIKFLDEQFSEFTTRKKKLSEAGKKGAIAKKDKAKFKAPLSQASAIREDKEKIKIIVKEEKKKITIEDRLVVFEKSVIVFKDEYTIDMLEDFISYWSEYGENDKKMRYEKMTSFSIKRRLNTWLKNSKKFNNGSQKNTSNNRARTTTAERQDFG